VNPAIGRTLGLVVAVLFCGMLLSYGVTQEVPIGRLGGKVVMQENGKPLKNALVIATYISTPDDDRPRIKGVETDEEGNFAFRNLPAGEYQIEVTAKEHSMSDQKVTIEEGKTQTLDLKADPVDPYLTMYASQKVFTPDETPRVELHGFTHDPKVSVHVYRLDLDKLAAKGGLDSAIYPLVNDNGQSRSALKEASTKAADLSHEVEKRDAEGAFIETLPIGKLGEGVYLVNASADGKTANAVLNVSQLALVTASGNTGTLCYATDIATGQPVPGADIFARDAKGLRRLGKTDKEGVLEAKGLDMAGESHGAIVAKHGISAALVGLYADRIKEESVWISGFCERPAYRPGDEIHFKGYVRRVAGDGYRLPGNGEVAIEVRDPDGTPIQKMSLPISVHGSFNGTFTTSKESKPGSYNLYCKAFGFEDAAIYANVVAYRKPEFSIEVKPKKDFYVMGEKGGATVDCKYYYGGPVVGAKVNVSIYRSPSYTYSDEEGGEEESGSYSGAGEYSQNVVVVTDAMGRANVDFDTKVDTDPDVFTNNYTYTVSASVTEDGGKYFDGEGEVKVVRGDFDLSADVQNPILQKGDTVDLLLKTTDPLDSQKVVPNREILVEAGREEWAHNTSVFVPRNHYTVQTGADGTAHVKIPVDRDESISIRATARDDRGNQVVANAWGYVVGSPAQADAAKGDLKVTLDKRHYTGGDSAKVLIQTDMPGGSALVSLQTDRILWRQIVPLNSESAMVTIPIKKEFSPNVFVSVAYVREKHFLQAEKRIKVEREDRKLKISVKSDREVYKPGETAQVTVKTTDSAGHPVPAEISLGVVDEGIYDVAEDDTDLYASLYPERSNGVRIAYSFPEIYLDGGDKGAAKVPLRKNFKDTAQWVPSTWTGASGEVTLPITLPDNLTEWRLTAVGLTDNSEAGINTGSFRVKKDLMVRLQLPQYLVDGDHQRMTVVVANDTGKDQDVSVELGATGVQLSGNLKQTIRVPSGQPQVVEMDAVAGAPGNASVNARAFIDASTNDGVEQSFPILAHGRPTLATKAGEGNLTTSFPVVENTDPNYGNLTVKLSPTLAGDLVKTMDGLLDFPYGCVEQTMSRFMPSVLISQSVKQLGLTPPKRLAEVPQITNDSLTRLSVMHHGDGGWGWWEYDDSDPFMTALVLDGLDRARTAGIDVSKTRPEQAADWGLRWLQDKTKTAHADDRDILYMADVLMRWGKSDAAKVLDSVNLKDHQVPVVSYEYARNGRKKEVKSSYLAPSTAALATGVLAFKDAGRIEEAKALLAQLTKRAKIGEADASWASEEGAWGEEVTALALVAYEALQPNDPITVKIVQHLMNTRRNDMWWSTRDTSYSIVGLTAYLSHSQELSNTSTVAVLVNGRTAGTVTLNPKVTEDPSWTITVPRKDLGNGEVRVEIQKQGAGSCYYNVALSGLDVSPMLAEKSTDPSLTITRKYFKLEAQALDDGTMKLLPTKKEVTNFANGDLVRVELTINSDTARQFVLVEEPTPSNCRVTERTELEEYEPKSWWWSRTLILDDHLAFFTRWLPKGESKITYNMRAEQAGQVRALPSTIDNMYDPGRWASTAETTVEVTK